MPSSRQLSRIDTAELKSLLYKKLGRQKADKYFYNLKRLLSLKLSKLEFDKLCYKTIGKENLGLHNMFIRSILSNACLALGPPSKQTVTAHSRTTKVSSISNTFPPSPQRGRSINSIDHQLMDGPRSLLPCGKMPSGQAQEVINSCDLQRSREQQSLPELISVGSKAFLDVVSVEDGEEVEQVRGSPSVQSRSPLRPPLGIPAISAGLPRKSLRNVTTAGFQTCHGSSELPDSKSLKRRLERILEVQGLGLSTDCANVLNHGLDAFLRRLIKPCMDLASARRSTRRVNQANLKVVPTINGLWQVGEMQTTNQSYCASLLDFRVAVESNPRVLGSDWPLQLEKICLCQSEE